MKGLGWLLESLAEANDDRQADNSNEAIPLLPLEEHSIKAMDDHNFLNFIAKMGLTPPSNEQVKLGLDVVYCETKTKRFLSNVRFFFLVVVAYLGKKLKNSNNAECQSSRNENRFFATFH